MAAKKKRKQAVRLKDAPVGSLVRQPHGGALRNGGTNKGGPGRPPEYLRMKSRELFERWQEWAFQTSKPGPKCKTCGRSDYAPDADVMNQIGKTAGRFGFPSEDSVSRQYVRDILQKQVEIIMNTLSSADADRLLSALHALWFPA